MTIGSEQSSSLDWHNIEDDSVLLDSRDVSELSSMAIVNCCMYQKTFVNSNDEEVLLSHMQVLFCYRKVVSGQEDIWGTRICRITQNTIVHTFISGLYTSDNSGGSVDVTYCTLNSL